MINIIDRSGTGNDILISLANREDFIAVYNHDDFLSDIKGYLKAHFRSTRQSTVSGSLTVANLLPSTKALIFLQYPHYKFGKLEAQYFNRNGSFTTAVSLCKSPTIGISATMGTSNIFFGAKASYSASMTLPSYAAGLSFTSKKGDAVASVILSDRGDLLTASWMRQLSGIAYVGEISRRFSSDHIVAAVGGSIVYDDQTTVKARVNSYGQLVFLLDHHFSLKDEISTILTIYGAVNTTCFMDEPKIGLRFSVVNAPIFSLNEAISPQVSAAEVSVSGEAAAVVSVPAATQEVSEAGSAASEPSGTAPEAPGTAA